MKINLDMDNPANLISLGGHVGDDGRFRETVHFLGEEIAELPEDYAGYHDREQICEEYGEKVAQVLASLIRERLT